MTTTTRAAPRGDLERRALAAYYRLGERYADTPSVTEVIDHNGKRYVRLANATGILALFRVRTNLTLKRLKRFPSGLAS